jgi:hypothetical protein
MNDPLYSERAGRARSLSASDLANLLWKHYARERDRTGFLAESILGYIDEDGMRKPGAFPEPEEWLTMALAIGSRCPRGP